MEPTFALCRRTLPIQAFSRRSQRMNFLASSSELHTYPSAVRELSFPIWVLFASLLLALIPPFSLLRKALFILTGTARTLWPHNCHEGYSVVQTVPVCNDVFLEHANNQRLLWELKLLLFFLLTSASDFQSEFVGEKPTNLRGLQGVLFVFKGLVWAKFSTTELVFNRIPPPPLIISTVGLFHMDLIGKLLFTIIFLY